MREPECLWMEETEGLRKEVSERLWMREPERL